MAADRARFVRVRPASPRDEADVGSLLRACYPALLADHYPATVLDRALPGMCRANPALLSCPTWYVATLAERDPDPDADPDADEGRVVGCGGWTFARPGTGEREPGIGHLRHFATHPDQLRRGVAWAIVDACFASARVAGVRLLECYSTRAAERFYAACGFVRLAEIGLAMPDPEGVQLELPAIHMRAPLD